MAEKKDGNSSIAEYLKNLRENKGGAFKTNVIKHGGSLIAIAATAASQLNELMNELNRDVITIKRKKLPELLSTKALKPPRAGRAPTLKYSVREYLKERGFKVVYAGGLIDFIRIEPKKK